MTTDRKEDLEDAGLWPQIGLPIPEATEAVVDPLKLYGYALSETHATGKHKARVFKSALGLSSEDWELLRDQILEKLPECPIYVAREGDEHPTWGVRIPIEGNGGKRGTVVTAWKMLDGRPQLVSCRVA